MPAGTPVHFSIVSASVFNVFFVPRLGSMIYAMPGMVSQLSLQADRPGVLWGTSAQFSGDGFSDMQFESQRVAPSTYRHANPGLFRAIASQEIAPAPGPPPDSSQHAGREVVTGGKD
jgi:cytochrome o ubiquinol oxidase subunit II